MNSKPTRCVIVSGASSGIGDACCQRLQAAGHQVIGLSRTAAQHVDQHYPVDLHDSRATQHTLTEILSQYPVDGLLCNAGQGHIASLENFSAEQIQASIGLNLISPLVLARLCIPIFRKRQRSDVLFIGSQSALQGGRYGSVYSAAKFGLRGAAQSLRQELAGSNCHVGIVQPGMVRTAFFDQLDFSPGPETQQALQADDVVDAVMLMLEAADHAVIDEIVVTPRQHVVQKKPRQG